MILFNNDLRCIYYRAAPVVTVVANITTPETLVLGQAESCTVAGETTVVCFNVSVCFNMSTLPGDSIENFSKNLSIDCSVVSNASMAIRVQL